MESEKAPFSMARLIYNLLHEMPFLGIVLNEIKRVADEKVPTACISSQNVLLYNPAFMNSLSENDQKAVVFHEVLHKAHKHFLRGDALFVEKFGYSFYDRDNSELPVLIRLNMGSFAKILNYGMDIAVWELVEKRFPLSKEVREKSWVRSEAEEAIKHALEPDHALEYYVQMLELYLPKTNISISLPGEGEHDQQMPKGPGEGKEKGEGESTEGEGYKTPQECQEEMDKLLRKAMEKQREWEAHKGIGSGDSLCKLLPDMSVKVKEPVDFWKSLISSAFGETRTNEHEVSLKRPNRRLPDLPFGKIRKTRARHCVFILDTSASIGQDCCQKFLAYVNQSMKKQGLTCDLLLTHTDVWKAFEKLRQFPLNWFKANSSHTGGTDLTTAQQWILDKYPKRKDITAIVLTDGETPWLNNMPFTQLALYTRRHDKLKGIKRFAVLSE
jgi:predicted metal-dependent peptidase